MALQKQATKPDNPYFLSPSIAGGSREELGRGSVADILIHFACSLAAQAVSFWTISFAHELAHFESPLHDRWASSLQSARSMQATRPCHGDVATRHPPALPEGLGAAMGLCRVPGGGSEGDSHRRSRLDRCAPGSCERPSGWLRVVSTCVQGGSL